MMPKRVKNIICKSGLFLVVLVIALTFYPSNKNDSNFANDLDVVSDSNILYFPTIKPGKDWQSTISITNSECKSNQKRVNATLTAYDKDGLSLGVIKNVIRLRANKTKTFHSQKLPTDAESLRVETNGNLICNAIFKTRDGTKSEVVPAIKESSKQLDFPALLSYDDLYIYKTITLLNPTTNPASVDIVALDKDGYEIDRNALPSLSSMESKTFSLVDIFGTRILKDLSTVRVNSDSNIIGLQLVDYPGVDLVGLPALATTSKGWTFPIATKGETFDLWTKVGILNPGDVVANVTIEAYDASNNSLGIIHSQTILPGVTNVINTANLDTIEGDTIPSNTAILKVTSNQLVIGYEVIGVLNGSGLSAVMGIPDEDHTIVGFELTGSMDGSMLNTYSMLRMGDGSVKSTAGSLGREEWRENANIIPDTSEIISEPTTEINKNADVSQNSGTSFTLQFPLIKYKNWTPYTANIASVFDHSRKGKVVEAYTAEIGNVEANTTNSPGYSNEGGTDFLVNNHYVGASGGTTYKSGKKYLNYDGHPAYDYPVEIGTPVYAAAEGTIHKAEWNVDENGKDAGGGYYIKIKHDNGAYYTSYLHLSEDSTKKKYNWKVDDPVVKGQQIAFSGDTGYRDYKKKPTRAHLHFEVRKTEDSPDKAVDPYGWHPSVPTKDPYTSENKTLWAAAEELPQITSISPSSEGVGTSVTITGNRFGGATGTVKFGTATATVTSWNETTIIATAPAGNGEVYVRVTTAGKETAVTSTGDDDEEKKGYVFTYTSQSKSDLVIQNLSVSPNSGSAGSSAKVSFTIYNQGTGMANSSTTNILINSSSSSVSTSDTVLTSVSTSSISSGSTSPVDQSVTIPSSLSAGTYYIWVWADVNSTANQSNVSNDKAYTSFTVPTSYKSDLVIQNLSVSPNSGSAGSSAKVSFTIYNQGNGAANSSTTNIRINSSSSSVSTSDTLLTSISTSSISSGGTSYVNQSVTIPSSLSAGTYYIWVWADVNNTANQSDTSNDKTKTSFTIKGESPTVTVTSPNGGESWTAGSTYTISWSVSGNTSNINYFWTAYSTDGGSSFTNIVTASPSDRSASWTIPPSVSSTQCKVRVRALDSSGNILVYDISDSNFTTTGGGSTPGSITDLTATPECDGTTSQIRLNWSAASNATSYDVYRDSSLYWSNVAGTQFINSDNITSGTTYSYYVQAKNSYGSTNSNTVSETAKTCSNTITHTLTPPSETTVSQGGFLGPFTVEESNNSSSYYAFYVQPYIIRPDGTTENSEQISTGLDAGESRTHYFYLEIPSGLELGTFTLGVKLTDTSGNVIDDDSVKFTVISGTSFAVKRSARRLKRLMKNPEGDGWKVIMVPERNR